MSSVGSLPHCYGMTVIKPLCLHLNTQGSHRVIESKDAIYSGYTAKTSSNQSPWHISQSNTARVVYISIRDGVYQHALRVSFILIALFAKSMFSYHIVSLQLLAAILL